MTKIQIDLVNGIEVVDSFDDDAISINDFSVSDLHVLPEGFYSTEVTAQQLEEIKEEFGIK